MRKLTTHNTYESNDDTSESRTLFSEDFNASEFASKTCDYRSTRIQLFVDSVDAYEIRDVKQDDDRLIRTLCFKAPDGGRVELTLFELPKNEEK